MTAPKSTLIETHRGYEIRHRPWHSRHPWNAQLPNPDGANRWCGAPSLQKARELIDKPLLLMKRGVDPAGKR